MRTASVSVAALLLGTAVLVVGTLLTFATTLAGEPAALGTLVVLLAAVVAASAFGALGDTAPKTPYW